MKTTLRIPGLSPAVSQLFLHLIAVFVVAFGTQLVAGATNIVNVNTLLALLISAASAGLVAVVHVALGLIPTPGPVTLLSAHERVMVTPLGITLKVKTAGYQVLVSVISTFVVILGAQLVAGGAHITSLPDAVAVLLAAISAAVTGVVTFLTGLIPAPKAST